MPRSLVSRACRRLRLLRVGPGRVLWRAGKSAFSGAGVVVLTGQLTVGRDARGSVAGQREAGEMLGQLHDPLAPRVATVASAATDTFLLLLEAPSLAACVAASPALSHRMRQFLREDESAESLWQLQRLRAAYAQLQQQSAARIGALEREVADLRSALADAPGQE